MFDIKQLLLQGVSSLSFSFPLTSAFHIALSCCIWYSNMSRLSVEYHQQHRNQQRLRRYKTHRKLSRHARAGTLSSAGTHRRRLPPHPRTTPLACWTVHPRHTSLHRRCGLPGYCMWQTTVLQPPWRLKTVCPLTLKFPSAPREHLCLPSLHPLTNWPNHLSLQPVRFPAYIRHNTNPWTSLTHRMKRMKSWAHRLTRVCRSWYSPRFNFCLVRAHQFMCQCYLLLYLLVILGCIYKNEVAAFVGWCEPSEMYVFKRNALKPNNCRCCHVQSFS